MSRTRLGSLAFAVIVALIGLVGFVPIASAQAIVPHQQMGFDPDNPCSTNAAPPGIQMISGTTGDVIPVPTTSISVDPCTLSFLLHKGNPAKVTVQADNSIPAVFVPIFKQAVVSHARDLWNKDLTCPNPEDGVFFNVITPTVWTTFTPIFYYNVVEELHPTVACA